MNCPPTSAHNLLLAAPIDRWDEAIPLGNGMLGVLLWGEGNRLRLSLDRGDLWDLRPFPPFASPEFNYATLKRWVKERQVERLAALFCDPGNEYPYPTKLPAGRLELTLKSGRAIKSFELDLHAAVGKVHFDSGDDFEIFCADTPHVIVARFDEERELGLEMFAPFSQMDQSNPKAPNGQLALWTLGYPPPQCGGGEGLRWTLQRCADGLAYAVVVGWGHAGGRTTLACAITTNREAPDAVELGKQRVAEALGAGFDALLGDHLAWWRRFWSASSISIPAHPELERHYYFVQYLYGAASRRGTPPIALQGLWTADEGSVPPWRGDYHHDLNSQFTYYAYQTAGRNEEGLCFLDWLWDLLPLAKRFARDFYGREGAAYPGVTALDGQPIAGWEQYNLSPTSSAWLGHLFYLHWRYTMDREFLAERAYPVCAQIGIFLRGILEPDALGRLKLPLSSSPEIHGNSLAAWLTPNSNYDLALLRWLFGALAEMAGALDEPMDRSRWQDLLGRLDDFAVAVQADFGQGPGPGPLLLAPDEALLESHRHHSHLMAIHPLGLMHVEGSDADRQVIDQSLRQILRLGTGFWCGYSFAWMACIAARSIRPQMALHMLDSYLKGFISRNGFHVNGDFKRLGLSGYDSRPFTLEGNFAAAQAVHEMLLQSWGGIVRIFPALPEQWADASFTDLRAEGAFKVSALRERGGTTWVRIVAEKDGALQLRAPAEGMRWNGQPSQGQRGTLRFDMRAGACVEGYA